MSITTFPPGCTIGILGGGQLGRMIAIAARRMGYRVTVLSPEARGPAHQVADHAVTARFGDREAVERWAREADVVTVEFENIPAEALRWSAAHAAVAPSPEILEVAQERIREKTTLADAGLPVTPFVAVRSEDDLAAVADYPGFPCVLKTARSGYDGKGQAVAENAEELIQAVKALGMPLVAERRIDFQREVSILVARNARGQSAEYPLIENRHANHILDVSVCPATDAERLDDQAVAIARRAAERLELVGLLCIELFVTGDGGLMINEIAPRPHNSGHLTIEAFACCQFQQLVRAICGLPLAEPKLVRPAAMANLLGDLWDPGPPTFDRMFHVAETNLHLYGKTAARPGRKMGHVTALAETPEAALRRALAARGAILSDEALHPQTQ